MNGRLSERGAAILWLFVAVALFGLLAYAFLNNSRTGLSWIADEHAKTVAAISQDCTNSTSMAAKRLDARGCGDLISYNTDGSPSPGGPADGSCSIFHPNGGGARACGTPSVAAAPCGPSPTLGQVCDDGSIYAGLTPDGNVPMYITDASLEAHMNNWGPHIYNGVPHCAAGTEPSCTTGESNTEAFATNAANNVPVYCANLTAHGHNDWYLPSRQELTVLFTLRQNGFGSLRSSWYFSSSESSNAHAWLVNIGSGSFFQSGWKPNTDYVRCARKHP